MKVRCEIDHVRTLKKGSKLIFSLDDDNTDLLMANIQNFRKLPLVIELRVDEEEQKERLGQIVTEQRSKVYALFREIAEHIGDTVEGIKDDLKAEFMNTRGLEEFSLSNCTKHEAREFIEWLLEWAFENEVPLSHHPTSYVDDIEGYLRICLKQGVCAICGKPAEVHHWDAIGAGRDRRKYDDSDHRKIALCRKHHSEVEQIGRDSFEAKYHVYGVIYDEAA